jgi:hypothetical protein
MSETKKLTKEEAAALIEIYPLPWTFENLGEEKYAELAVAGGYFMSPPPPDYRRDLHPPEEVIDLVRKDEPKFNSLSDLLARKRPAKPAKKEDKNA